MTTGPVTPSPRLSAYREYRRIPSNIAEGCERDSQAEIARFFTIAKGSCGELITQIYIGIDVGFIGHAKGMNWVREAKEKNAILGALIKKHRRKD